MDVKQSRTLMMLFIFDIRRTVISDFRNPGKTEPIDDFIIGRYGC